MADAKDFQFAITGVDESEPAWTAATQRANRGHKKLQSGADRTRSRFAKIIGPARELAPALDRVLKPLEKAGRVSRSFGDAFTRDGRAVQQVTARNAAAFTRATSAAATARQAFTSATPRLGFAQLGAQAGFARTEIAAAGTAAEGAGGAIVGMAEGAMGLATGIAAIAIAIPAAIAGAGVLAAKFVSPFARAGQEVRRTSDLIGMNAQQLQRWRGAAERAGLSAGAADASLANVGQALHNTRYGIGDPNQTRLLGLAGVDAEKDDQDAATKKISAYLARMRDPFTRRKAAGILGVESLLPMLAKGPDAIAADQAGYDKTGAAFTGEELDKADRAGRSLTSFDQSKKGLAKRSAMGVVADGAILATDTATGAMQGLGSIDLSVDGAGKALDGIKRPAADAAKALASVAKEALAPSAHAETGNFAARAGEDARRAGMARRPIAPARTAHGRGLRTGQWLMKEDVVREVLQIAKRLGASNMEAITLTSMGIAESQLSSDRPGDINKKGMPTAWGMFQHRNGRLTDFEKRFGHPMKQGSREEQVAFALYEMRSGPEKKAGERLAALSGGTDYNAGIAVGVRDFERPKYPERDIAKRRAVAADLLEAYPQFKQADRAEAGGEVRIVLEGFPGSAKIITKSGTIPLKTERAMTGAGR